MYAKDYRTWIGHGLQGVLIAALCDWWGLSFGAAALVLGYHFLIRETEGIIRNIDGDKRKLIDGIMDLITPFIGLVLYIVLKEIICLLF